MLIFKEKESMKKLISPIVILLLSLLVLQCGKGEDGGGSDYPTPNPSPTITITASDFSVTIAENPAAGAVLGTVQASASSGASVGFAITSQSVAGAITINATNGELTVADASLFDFETQTTLTAVVRVSAGSVTEDVNVTITLTDVDETVASTLTLWQGPIITFSKPNGGDPNDEANQDRITDNVWITRGNNTPNTQGQVYNIVSESVANDSSSPAGTAWAQGTYATIDDLTFSSFRSASPNQRPKNVVGIPMVLHIIEDDIYIEIKFTSWATSKQGGFAYERRTAE